MQEKEYEKVGLFIGVLSSIGFPLSLREELEGKFGPIEMVSEPFVFDYTDYYNDEMGVPIERFFIFFSSLIRPDLLSECKLITNKIEKEWEIEGKRKINLDPGTISEANVILATTKNRAHRVAIGNMLYAEITLIYQKHSYISFPWTYSDYKSEGVQRILLEMRRSLLNKRKDRG